MRINPQRIAELIDSVHMTSCNTKTNTGFVTRLRNACHDDHRIDRFRETVILVAFDLLGNPHEVVVHKTIKEIDFLHMLNFDDSPVINVFGK